MNLVFGKPRGLLSGAWVDFQVACATATQGRGMRQFPRPKGGKRGAEKRKLRALANAKIARRNLLDRAMKRAPTLEMQRQIGSEILKLKRSGL